MREADLAADSYDPGAPEAHPLLGEIFVVSRDGEILLPSLESHPPVAPPPEEEEAQVRRFLSAADRELAATSDPDAALLFVEPVVTDYVHPDLVAVLEDRAAELHLIAGRPEKARVLLEWIVEKLTGARDLEGAPVAPISDLKLLRLLAEAGDREALRAGGRRLASRLADQAWGLRAYERAPLWDRLREILTPDEIPADVLERASFVRALRTRVIPEALALLASGETTAWRHLVRRDGPLLQVLGFRSQLFDDSLHIYGYRLRAEELRRRIRVEAEAIVELNGGRILIDTAPPLKVGGPRIGKTLVLDADLGGDLRSVGVRVRLPAPTGLRVLKTLHLLMTALLTIGLLTGILLSLRAVRRELAAARLKQDFIDNISHEIRTPLTSVRMYAEMLSEEELPEEKRSGYLRFIHSESKRLSRLIEDVLDFSRLARGQATLRGGPVPPVEIAQSAVAAVESQAREAGFTVKVDVPADLPRVLADRDSAVRGLTNLLANAIAYSGESREVGIEGSAEGRRVLLVVWDRGPGVPEDARRNLFTRFYRAPRDARRTKGVGLGLVLAREIARVQGGDVFLESTSGKGSRFVLALPVAPEERKT